MKISNRVKGIIMSTAVIVSLLTMVGCSSTNEELNTIGYKNIDATQTEKVMENTEGVLVVDVRTQEEYKEGHLPYAINIPYDDFESKLDKLENYKDKTILLYCKTGNRSEKAAKILAENGFKDVQNATEGVEEHEYNLVKYDNIVGQELEQILSENKDILLIDARKEKEYKEGYIENAINIPVEDMESKVNELGDYKDKAIVIYCRTGKRSAEAAKILSENGFTNVTNVVDGVSEYSYKLVK